MKIPIYQVDAFTGNLFAGNPAAICPLESWLDTARLQSIAAENNLSETAFFVRTGDRYHLRWFTPAVEVDLCGHATLAAAYVIFRFLEPSLESVEFDTRSGVLVVKRAGEQLAMDFPARKPEPVGMNAKLIVGLGKAPVQLLASRDYLAVYSTEEDVRGLRPDMNTLSGIDRFAVIATAPGRDCDFVSRFFAPAQGVPEDPVTGSAHCTLAPYWSERLGKSVLRARQVSARGGELVCEMAGDRVILKGQSVLYLEGSIYI
ncbi:MAG: PhzF family phenazine biosynthesis protein [Bryobacteraceae bacterium]